MIATCAACGADNPPTARFCGACGVRLAMTCPHCQATVSGTTRFCTACGGTLPAADRGRNVDRRRRCGSAAGSPNGDACPSCSSTSRTSRAWPNRWTRRRSAASRRATSRPRGRSSPATAARSRSSSVTPSWRCGARRSPTRTTRSARCAPLARSSMPSGASGAPRRADRSPRARPSPPARRRSRSERPGRAWSPATSSRWRLDSSRGHRPAGRWSTPATRELAQPRPRTPPCRPLALKGRRARLTAYRAVPIVAPRTAAERGAHSGAVHRSRARAARAGRAVSGRRPRRARAPRLGHRHRRHRQEPAGVGVR